MRYKYDCGVLLNYSPRGRSEIAVNSRIVKGRIKNADLSTIEAITRILNENAGDTILNENSCLVPIPRSSPLINGALWPTREICETFVKNGIGNQVAEIISRREPVPKSSSFYNADERPSIQTHIESLAVSVPPPQVETVTLIDDVLTLGRITAACAYLIQEKFPGIEVKIFCLMRTMGNVDDIAELVHPRTSYIQYNTETGKSWIPEL